MTLEICSMCDGPTGRSGRLDDSLYCERDGCERGPFCEACHVTHLAECEISRLKSERDFNAASLRDANAEIARLRAEVERLTRDRDLAERKAAVCREDAEISARRAESAEARVAELEELHRMREAAISVAAQCNTESSAKEQRIERGNPYWTPAYSDVCAAVDREIVLRARVAELEAELARRPRITVNERIAPPLVFDAGDPLPDMTPAPTLTPEESAEIRRRHAESPGIDRVCALLAGNAERFEARAKSLPLGDFCEKPAPCGTCGDSGSGGWPCEDCGAGMPCGKRGGSGAVERDGLDEMCPDCRGGGKK